VAIIWAASEVYRCRYPDVRQFEGLLTFWRTSGWIVDALRDQKTLSPELRTDMRAQGVRERFKAQARN
jgi:hypothetical protein